MKAKIVFLIELREAWTARIGRGALASFGRLDVALRAINAALDTPVAYEVSVKLALEGPPSPPVSIEVDGKLAKPIAGEQFFKTVLNSLYAGGQVAGFSIKKQGFMDQILEAKNKGYSLYWLEENGRNIRGTEIHPPALFILGDHKGFSVQAEKMLRKLKVPRVSLGPLPYFTSHCIIIVLEELIRRGILDC